MYRSTAWNGNGQVEVDKVVPTFFRNVYFIIGQIGSLMFSSCTVELARGIVSCYPCCTLHVHMSMYLLRCVALVYAAVSSGI